MATTATVANPSKHLVALRERCSAQAARLNALRADPKAIACDIEAAEDEFLRLHADGERMTLDEAEFEAMAALPPLPEVADPSKGLLKLRKQHAKRTERARRVRAKFSDLLAAHDIPPGTTPADIRALVGDAYRAIPEEVLYAGFNVRRVCDDLVRTTRELVGQTNVEAERASRASSRNATRNATAREQNRMTCQICARDIATAGQPHGFLAHHGYQRPGYGSQTASCPGARTLPFEVSSKALRNHLDACGKQLAVIVQERAETAQPGVTIHTSYTRRDYHRSTVFLKVTEENFGQVKAEHPEARHALGYRFEDLRERKLAELDREIRHMTSYITAQQARLSSHTVTHARCGDRWEPISR